jgi:hypothetical protein
MGTAVGRRPAASPAEAKAVKALDAETAVHLSEPGRRLLEALEAANHGAAIRKASAMFRASGDEYVGRDPEGEALHVPPIAAALMLANAGPGKWKRDPAALRLLGEYLEAHPETAVLFTDMEGEPNEVEAFASVIAHARANAARPDPEIDL